MKKILLFLLFLIAATFNCKSQNLTEKQKVIHDIDSLRIAFHIPGIVFGVAKCDSTLIMGSLGVREINRMDSVTIYNKFHIASLGKGLFSFISGKLVDEGKITWDTRFF